MQIYSITLRNEQNPVIPKGEVVAKDVHVKVANMWQLPAEVLMLKLAVASNIMATRKMANKCDMRLPERDFVETIKRATPKTVWQYKKIKR